MHLHIAGRGNMAQAIEVLCKRSESSYSSFDEASTATSESIAIHVGSKKRLEKLLPWCTTFHVPLIHAASGYDDLLPKEPEHPIVLAPNLALPVVVFLETLLPQATALFRGMNVGLVESHQSTKTTVAGTARAMARVLDIPEHRIRSVRDQRKQLELGVPEKNLGAHAYHWMTFTDHLGVSIQLSTQVTGQRTYAFGAVYIAEKLATKRAELQNKVYSVQEVLNL